MAIVNFIIKASNKEVDILKRFIKISLLIIVILLFTQAIYSEELFPFRLEGKYGFMDTNLWIKIPAIYHMIKPFNEYENTTVRYDVDYAGVIDKNGNELLRIEASTVRRIYKNIFYITDFSCAYLYDLDRDLVISKNIRSASFSPDGKIAVTFIDSGRATYINTEGVDIFPNKSFRRTFPFFEGRALVIEHNWDVSLIDDDGNYVKERAYGRCDINFSDGLCFVSLNDKRGYINTDGDYVFILPDTVPRNENLNYTEFNDGYAAFKQKSRTGDSFWTIIDTSGNIVSTNLKFDEVAHCQNGFFKISRYVEQSYESNFIDIYGNVLSDEYFDYTENFVNGYAIISLNGRDGLISKSGEVFFIE